MSALTALSLAACAPMQPRYADSPQLRACQYEAKKATAGGGDYGMRTSFGQAMAQVLAERDVIDACMAQYRP